MMKVRDVDSASPNTLQRSRFQLCFSSGVKSFPNLHSHVHQRDLGRGLDDSVWRMAISLLSPSLAPRLTEPAGRSISVFQREPGV